MEMDVEGVSPRPEPIPRSQGAGGACQAPPPRTQPQPQREQQLAQDELPGESAGAEDSEDPETRPSGEKGESKDRAGHLREQGAVWRPLLALTVELRRTGWYRSRENTSSGAVKWLQRLLEPGDINLKMTMGAKFGSFAEWRTLLSPALGWMFSSSDVLSLRTAGTRSLAAGEPHRSFAALLCHCRLEDSCYLLGREEFFR
ncbi:hypothetical protein H920_11318 [Fukomys damarensis]|uniref:Uncharacterized protein n=1 Tax=Fukomys damarensis TaxID=885580 RepID=A0A091DAL4_FUKDA|nr:hypothetical protein H920_11318 [Fukomys damarensis]